MPRWLRQFLVSHDLRFHLKMALGVGLLVRLLSAVFVYGPQALDDYKHGVWPAYQFFAGLPLDLPQYRSHLLIWVLSGFVRVASWFGAESALAQVRAMYIGLGVVSLSSIWGAYLCTSHVRSRLFPPLTLYWMALFPLMPFVGTRAFGEALALGLVVLGFGILEHARAVRRDSKFWWFCGFAVLGLASLFRFHVGLLYLGYMGFLLWKGPVRGWIQGILAGLFTLASQCAIDALSGKGPMETLFVYLRENEGGATKYGVSPWYNPLLFVLAVSLAPFSFAIMGNMKGLWRRWSGLVIPFAIFLMAHSAVPHKEERFLYPILGLEFILVCYLWASSAHKTWARRVYSPAVFFIGGLALMIVCFVNTQEGEIEPPAYMESRYRQVTYLDFESLFGASRFQFYFLRPPSVLEKVDAADFNAHRVDEALKDRPEHRAVVLLTSNPEARDQLRAMEGVSTMEGRCLQLRTAGSVVDQALYAMNPKHNQRRRPTWYLVCERNGI